MTAAKPAVRVTEERKPGVRELAAQATRESILKAAIKVFAKNGFDGGRVEQISKAAKSYDRMIYYYFGSKEGLYIAALEEIYRRFNDAESELHLDESKPREALRAVIRFMWSYYLKHPEFITLLNTENLHRGKHIAKSPTAKEYSSPAVGVIERVLRTGATQGLFRADLTARDLYLTIAGLCYFYLSNRFTLSAFLGEDLETPAALQQWQAHVIDTVERTVAPAMSAVSVTSKGNGHG
jgi:TetR/AcrR family transcriptional regulator, upper aerobic nicotinate degradation pathway regulator